MLVGATGCWLFGAGCLLIAAAGILLAGRKIFEYFQDIDVLQLKHFCRRKSREVFGRGIEEIWLIQLSDLS